MMIVAHASRTSAPARIAISSTSAEPQLPISTGPAGPVGSDAHADTSRSVPILKAQGRNV
jgi:hypothetical protein